MMFRSYNNTSKYFVRDYDHHSNGDHFSNCGNTNILICERYLIRNVPYSRAQTMSKCAM